MGPGTACYALRTRLVSRYADCLAWLKRPGLTTEAIFYCPTRARPDTHRLRPSKITVPAGEGTQLTVNCSNKVRYLG
jgi:hypothetical protein